MDRLATGIRVLDRQLDGGFPAGSVVVLTADPASQSELFVNTFAAARTCLYLTTARSATAVAQDLDRSPVDIENVAIRSVADDVSASEPAVEPAIDGDADREEADATAALSALPERSTLVIDSLEPLETADRRPYRRFLETVRRRVVDTDSIAVLHALRRDPPPARRPMSKHVADIVVELQTTTRGTELVNRLVVPKFRGGAALNEAIKLQLTETVSVDTSRDIA